MNDSPPVPDSYSAFLSLFAAGEYWSAHEALEVEWRATRSGFYKGLILLASAFVHAGRGNAHGVQAQLRKAARELERYAPYYLGQDVGALLELAGAPRLESRGRGLTVPPPDLTPRPAWFRGDEPELDAGRTGSGS